MRSAGLEYETTGVQIRSFSPLCPWITRSNVPVTEVLRALPTCTQLLPVQRCST